jgi:aminoglycoside phosphotransferase (APT) family kinase protein
MDHPLEVITRQATGASRIAQTEVIQTLWGGYGRLVRCRLEGAGVDSVIVKHVRWPDRHQDCRGGRPSVGHARKVRSYQVEMAWYERYAARCGEACRVPRCLLHETRGDEVFMVLEDLDAAGFGARRQRVGERELQACLQWLACFHATFMGERPEGLWPVGTYWHLDTRPEELEALDDRALRAAAAAIDRELRACPFQTFVHGDAKLENFCFSPAGEHVAAVDFQYVGGGCGIKDVAYLVSSCVGEAMGQAQERRVLDCYFAQLEHALACSGKRVDFPALHRSWRALYPVAWTDFFRFLQGWSPGRREHYPYSQRLAREVLEALEAP